nr:hypothetical protein [Bacillus thuringiensis]
MWNMGIHPFSRNGY